MTHVVVLVTRHWAEQNERLITGALRDLRKRSSYLLAEIGSRIDVFVRSWRDFLKK
jgi:hypothetical protein